MLLPFAIDFGVSSMCSISLFDSPMMTGHFYLTLHIHLCFTFSMIARAEIASMLLHLYFLPFTAVDFFLA